MSSHGKAIARINKRWQNDGTTESQSGPSARVPTISGSIKNNRFWSHFLSYYWPLMEACDNVFISFVLTLSKSSNKVRVYVFLPKLRIQLAKILLHHKSKTFDVSLLNYMSVFEMDLVIITINHFKTLWQLNYSFPDYKGPLFALQSNALSISVSKRQIVKKTSVEMLEKCVQLFVYSVTCICLCTLIFTL